MELGDQLAGPLDVGVHREAVISPQDDREVDVGHLGHRVIRQAGQRGGDLLHKGMFIGGGVLIGHRSNHTRLSPRPSPAQPGSLLS